MQTRIPAAVICDSPVLSLQLSRQLTNLGCATETFQGHPGKMRLAEFSIVLVELMLAGNNGFALLRSLRAELTMPLVLISGTGRSSDLHWGKTAGATCVLERPLDVGALAGALQLCGL